MEKISKVAAIKKFFETDGYPRVSRQELKELSPGEREELVILCAKELNCELA